MLEKLFKDYRGNIFRNYKGKSLKVIYGVSNMIRNLNKIEMLYLFNKLLKRYNSVYEGDV